MRELPMRSFAPCLFVSAVCALLSSAGAAEISNGVVRLGVLTDMSGTYSDIAGPGAVEAAKMAVKDFGGKVLGSPVEVIAADHQNKADVGLAKAREWYDVEVTERIQVSLGLLQDLEDDPTRGGVSPTRRK